MKATKFFGVLVSLSLIAAVLLAACSAPATPTTSSGSGTSAAPAAQQVTLRMAGYHPAESPQGDLARMLIAEVAKRSNNTVKIDYIPGGTLGAAGDILNLTQKGSIDIGFDSDVYYTEKLPYASARGDLGMLSGKTTKTGANADAYTQLAKEYPAVADEFTKMNLKLLAMYDTLPMNIFSAKPLKTVADLNGVKIRLTTKIWQAISAATGMVAVAMPIAETNDAMQKGVVSATISTADSITTWKHYEVAKYWLRNMPIGVGANTVMAINLDVLKKLSPDAQKALVEAGAAVQAQQSTVWEKSNTDAVTLLGKNGVQIFDLADAERDALHAKVFKSFFQTYVADKEKANIPNAKQVYTKMMQLFGGYQPDPSW